MRARGSLARLGALVLTAGAMLGGAACSLVAGLDKLSFTDAAVCGDACDDADPCTEGDCLIEGACHGTPVPDGPVLTDPSGDCHVTTCAAGVAKVTVDDSDLPADDGSSCTDERCADGTPSHPTRPDGDACAGPGSLGGICDGGVCAVKCGADADCDDQNPCTTEACDLDKLVCTTTLLDGVETPGAVSVPGNCHTQMCIKGVDTDAVDDDDALPSLNDCIAPTCSNGTLTMSPAAQGMACSFGGGHVCDGNGACVACNVAADCTTGKDECNVAACNANKTCGTAFAPPGTQLQNAPQVKGNCNTLYCNETGGTYSSVNNDDLPDDGNPCTLNTCTAGVPSNPPGPAGVDCGTGMKCNAAGLCKKATAQACTAGTECASGSCYDGVCCSAACATACKACNIAGSVGTCTNIAAGQHDTAPACAGVNFCDGAGACKLGAGQACTTAAQCISNVCTASVCQ